MTVGENIRRLRELHELTQRELGQIAGVSDKAVSTWENGSKMPRMAAIKRMAAYFGVAAGDLLDDEPRTPAEPVTPLFTTPSRPPHAVLRNGSSPLTADLQNVKPIHLFPASRRIPVLGRVPAGIPIEAVTDIIETIDLSGHSVQDGYDYFGLLVTGDSMLPEYRDGDVVILRMQQTAQTGDDVVAYIGNSDATLKRLTVTENGIQLRPLNPAYEIRSFSGEEIRTLPVTIAGIVIEQRRTRRHG